MDDNREFKINLHAGDPEDDLNRTMAFDKQAKPSTKASILFVVSVFIIFGGFLFSIYYNLNSKIQTINAKGSEGIASLSDEFNNKLYELSQQFSDQQETSRTLVSDLDIQLKKLNSSISAIQTDKLDKKDMAAAIKGIQNDLAPIQESINNFNKQLTGFADETKKINVSLNKLQTGVLNNNKAISTIGATHIDRIAFEKELKKEREFNQQNMAHASEALFSEIATLHQNIDDLNNKMAHMNIPSPQKSNKMKSPSEDLSVPKPGEIIELEIK